MQQHPTSFEPTSNVLTMDLSSYKDLETSRGIKYHYFYSTAHDSKPTLLLVHGFPSNSYDWRHQVAFFKKKGYGLVVPDMLGYGGTDKPTDPEEYRLSLICKDLVDILDAENVDKSIVIGHDWGSNVVSRLASYHADRFIGYAFLAVGYSPPSPDFDYEKIMAMIKQAVGYEIMGYWAFFSEDGADKVIEEHIDSFYSIVFPQDPRTWITDLGPLGSLKAWLLANKTGPPPEYLTEDERKIHSSMLLKGGLAAPVKWYKMATSGIYKDDDKNIPLTSYPLPHVPALFIGCTKDYICLFPLHKDTFEKLAPKGLSKVVALEADHWVMWSHKEQVNKELEEWIEQSILKG
ncbi:hypothetical protein JAAARDRAFT_29416 [Jaapia argillacea MUCL 33604]|uniref:AB hydrolase-1 domain-containing protein n=1 Tax=Jaapia argillacea MUCL 33604 TaxID=933084 RepID=A0A067QB73_9AGAM|nr:hypothetical protein JAAARDRAFT_29416 [Jaapia argillacea MUCL 33604]